ncbi:MAG: hypothetical protein U0930_05220 [Pirellulales bacterium]
MWFTSGIAAHTKGMAFGFTVLFLGRMLIFPIATLILRGVFGCNKLSRTNPGGLMVIETIFPMIGGLLAAWLLLPYRPDFVFSMSAIAVGTHYFGFRSAYGDWTNWILGGAICSVGVTAIFAGLPTAPMVPFVIAVLEMVFGFWLTWISLSKDRPAKLNSNVGR